MHVHVKGEENPLSRMRFLSKEKLPGIDKVSIEELPHAKEVPEADYEADIPRTFCENSIRLFCRNPEKAELAKHIFEQWQKKDTQTTPQPASKKSRRRTGNLPPEVSPGPGPSRED